MMIKNWKSKISTILIAGLIVSSVTVLAFADDIKKEAKGEALTKKETEVQTEIKEGEQLKMEQDITLEEIKVDIEKQVVAEGEQTEVKIINSSDEDSVGLKDEEANLELDIEIENDTIKNIEEEIKKEAEAEAQEQSSDITLATASDLEIVDDTADKEILGTWAVDEYTMLRFDEGGQGCMLLPESEYEFAYELEDARLMIDFVSSRANDAEYTISISDESMILTLTKEAQSKDFTLHKVK